MRNIRYVFFLLMLGFLITPPVLAQMFSVEEPSQRLTPPSAYFRIGLAPADFTYTGPFYINQQPEELEFNSNLLYFALETPGLSANLSLGNTLVGMDTQRFFALDLSFLNRFMIVRRPGVFAGIPIQIKTALTSASTDAHDENFYQTSFGVGGGAYLNFRIMEKIFFSNQFIPGYGFSSSSGGFIGGSIFYMSGQSRINILGLLGQRSVSFGYDYNFRSFDIDEDLFDYDLTTHVLTIGISL